MTNYGEILKTEITTKGYSKKKIAKKLAMSYNTLMLRLVDGEFTTSQVDKLKAERYLPFFNK